MSDPKTEPDAAPARSLAPHADRATAAVGTAGSPPRAKAGVPRVNPSSGPRGGGSVTAAGGQPAAERTGTQTPDPDTMTGAADSRQANGTPGTGVRGTVPVSSPAASDASSGANRGDLGGPAEMGSGAPRSWNQGPRWGIEVESLRMTAAGRALDFRFRIADPGTAASVGRKGGPMYILDAAGQRIAERVAPPIGGAFENRHLDQPDRIYSTWFANPGSSIKRGDFVTIVMGDFRMSGIEVR